MRWRHANVGFAALVKDAETGRELTCLRQIQKAARSGTWTAAAWMLERTNPAYRKQTVVVGDPREPVAVAVTTEDAKLLARRFAEMPIAELAALLGKTDA